MKTSVEIDAEIARTRADEAEIARVEVERLGVIVQQVVAERERQDSQWGGAEHDDGHERRDWLSFIEEHVVRARKAIPRRGLVDLDEHRKQLIEIAALAVAAVQSHDREQKR